jgi:hypothetical protein
MSLVGEYFCMKYELREISVVALAGTGKKLLAPSRRQASIDVTSACIRTTWDEPHD